MRGTYPLFNLGRQDLPWVVLLCVFLSSVALILRSGQGDYPQGKDAWKDLTIILCTVSAMVLCGLAVLKLIYPTVQEPLNEFLQSHDIFGMPHSSTYTPLEEGTARPQSPRLVQTKQVKPQMAEAPPPAREIDPQDSRPVSATGRSTYRSSYYNLRDEDDIECGLLLEASAVDFEYNGVRHQKGSLRVIKVEQDGVCERQGACVVGDVLVAVDGKQVAGMNPNKVKALMKGRAGTSIILGLYTDQSRELINRHVVLAPSPSSITLSPRGASLTTGRSSRP